MSRGNLPDSTPGLTLGWNGLPIFACGCFFNFTEYPMLRPVQSVDAVPAFLKRHSDIAGKVVGADVAG